MRFSDLERYLKESFSDLFVKNSDFQWTDVRGKIHHLNIENVTNKEELIRHLFTYIEHSISAPGGWLAERIEKQNWSIGIPFFCKESSYVPILLRFEPHVPSYEQLSFFLSSYLKVSYEAIYLFSNYVVILISSNIVEEEDLGFLESFGISSYLAIQEALEQRFEMAVHPVIYLEEISLPQCIDQLIHIIKCGSPLVENRDIFCTWKNSIELLLYSFNLKNHQIDPDISLWLTKSEYVSTIESFFENNCNLTLTAQKLFIHRNTLLYRIEKIFQETGYDIRIFQDATMMKIFIYLFKVIKNKG